MIKRQTAFFLLTLYLFFSLLAGCTKYKYPPGRDTECIYGDGTFQLLKGPDSKGLFYCPTGHCAIPNITHTWKVKDEVYCIGHYDDQTNVYGIVNITENTLQLCLEEGYNKYVPEDAIESGAIVVLPDFASFTKEAQVEFMEQERKDISQYPSYIPVIESFSSTEYQYDGYAFDEIKSVRFLYSGDSTELSANDPRVFRLLNALSFSAIRGHTQIRQEPVSKYEFNTYLESDTYLLDIEFQISEPPNELDANGVICRLIVSANRILVVDASGYTELHSPFQHVLKDPDKELSDSVWQKIAAEALWGDRKYLDLFWYADFATYDIPYGTVLPNP